jgi:nitrate reductase NapAB chaperone NapD
MVSSLLTQFKAYFLEFSNGIIKNLFLVCSAIITARSTNLNTLKDYLPQLLEKENTLVESHYKRSGSQRKLVVH